jgi:hypothetical protein
MYYQIQPINADLSSALGAFVMLAPHPAQVPRSLLATHSDESIHVSV